MPRRVKIAIAVLVTLLGITFVRWFLSSQQKTMVAAFPLSVLKKDPTLLDPRNTATTWEYYLLENLSLGLLRDDVGDPRGYAPGLALAWTQSAPDTWTFEMRPNLKWSDGSSMSLKEIADYYRRLKTTPSRHILYLRLVDEISLDTAKNLMTFHFTRPVGRSVLHELSLADAVYVHPSNLTKDWRITSGPYFVKSYDPDGLRLRLERNPFVAAVSGEDADAVPASVELFWTKDANFSLFFTEHGADLFTSGAFSFRNKVTALDTLAATRLQGMPTVVYYFEINSRHPLGNDRDYRRAFAAWVRSFFAAASLPSIMSFEEQMIPNGYYGRLHSVDAIDHASDTTLLKGTSLKLGLFPQMAELVPIFEALAAAAQKDGFRIEYGFDLATKDDSIFARSQVFKGNQKDASGTWSFLFSDPQTPLHAFATTIDPEMRAMLAATADDERLVASRALHQKVLSEALVVPFAREFTPVYASQRINLSRWNPFDMRLRFYDVRWK